MHPIKVDDEDFIYSLIYKIESSFHIKFDYNDFSEMDNFGDFKNVVLSKIDKFTTDDCTKQQCFYKVRSAFNKIDPNLSITLDTPLLSMFPKKKKYERVSEFNEIMGFDAGLLRIKNFYYYLMWVSIFLAVASFILSGFYDEPYHSIGVVLISINILCVSYLKIKKTEFVHSTVRDLVNQLSSDHYLKVRRDNNINKAELVDYLTKGIYDLGQEEEFDDNSKFVWYG